MTLQKSLRISNRAKGSGRPFRPDPVGSPKGRTGRRVVPSHKGKGESLFLKGSLLYYLSIWIKLSCFSFSEYWGRTLTQWETIVVYGIVGKLDLNQGMDREIERHGEYIKIRKFGKSDVEGKRWRGKREYGGLEGATIL